MKNVIMLLIVALLLGFGGYLLYPQEAQKPTLAENETETQEQDWVNKLATTIPDKLMDLVKENKELVIGKPITVNDVTLIPVNRVNFGFGLGGGSGKSEKSGGGGGGAGGGITPQALIVITAKGEVKVVFLEQAKKESGPGLDNIFSAIGPIMKMFGKEEKHGKTQEKSNLKLTDAELKELLEKGKTLFEKGEIEEASKIFEKCVNGASGNADSHAWLSLALGQMCGKTQDWQKQMEYGTKSGKEADKALELDPNNSIGRLSRGINRLMTPPEYGGSIEKAVEDLEAAVKNASEKFIQSESHYWLGLAYERKGEKDKAIAEWKETLKINPKHSGAMEKLKK
ncbi:MAG: spore germination protein GerW family protein [Planctomycetota bacterium]